MEKYEAEENLDELLGMSMLRLHVAEPRLYLAVTLNSMNNSQTMYSVVHD